MEQITITEKECYDNGIPLDDVIKNLQDKGYVIMHQYYDDFKVRVVILDKPQSSIEE